MTAGPGSLIQAGPGLREGNVHAVEGILGRDGALDGLFFGLAVCLVPVSIAISESFLAAALVIRIASIIRSRAKLVLPRVFWWWLAWAVLECVSWCYSPQRGAGWGELRHLLLVVTVILILPSQNRRLLVWRGIFLTATVSSLVLIVEFVARLRMHPAAAAYDPLVYLRNGGLLHHWMVYGTVEIIVCAGLLEYLYLYPEERRRWLPVAIINGIAIVLSLTRMLWVCCLIVWAVHLIRRRSRLVWALPVLPLAVFAVSPGAVRARVIECSSPDYYSNAERVQMLRVGWKMIAASPLTGVGPGRVENLYTSYLSKGDPVPAYHGHLHNNLAQLAAEFGVPVAAAAILFTMVLFRDLRARDRTATTREERFLSRTSLLALTGFLLAGIFDYTYGHSLGIILLSFVVFSPLVPAGAGAVSMAGARLRAANGVADRILGTGLILGSLPVMVATAVIIRLVSRRSPFVAHLRVGQHGQSIWVWKLRTMWTSAPPRPEELGWIQRVEAEPLDEGKRQKDPRITSRIAAFCRAHSIDELPQLCHVVRGEMSLVGPRPMTRGELARYYGSKAPFILSVKPGLTGYWQIQGRNRLSYAERVERDVRLVREMSGGTYFRVLLRTIPEIIGGKNAW